MTVDIRIRPSGLIAARYPKRKPFQHGTPQLTSLVEYKCQTNYLVHPVSNCINPLKICAFAIARTILVYCCTNCIHIIFL